jgi:ABC-type branched-subunit amino acid transport system ATPase component
MREILLEVEGLSKSLGGVKAVREVSLALPGGMITSVIGPNGAGKTTLFNVINGYVRHDSGAIRYKGVEIGSLSPSRRASLGIGRLWQDIRLFGNMTVLENLRAAKKSHVGESLIACFLRRNAVRRVEAEVDESAEKILELIRLEDKRHSLARDLSYGQQKLLGLGRLLMNGTDLLLLDEPTSGVNPLMIDRILEFVRRLSAEGKTILMIEHNIREAANISDWIHVMNEGTIIRSGSPASIISSQSLKEVYMSV